MILSQIFTLIKQVLVAILTLSLGTNFLGVRATQQLVGSLSTSEAEVGQTDVTLYFNLYTQGTEVEYGDYILIELPVATDAEFDTSGSPNCDALPLEVIDCNILSNLRAQIYFSTSVAQTQINGSITKFNNPQSTKTIEDIQIGLFGSDGTQKALLVGAILSNFQPASLTASLSSNNSVVGATSARLTLTLTPDTLMKSSGKVILTVPEYYTGAGWSNFFFEDTTPTCTGSSQIAVSQCAFSQTSLQVTIEYDFTTNSDSTGTHSISISSFKNPIKVGSQSGFYVETTDEEGYTIGESTVIALDSITTPTTFKSVTFDFDDTNRVGEYSSFRMNFELDVPTQQNCYFRISFPADSFILDDQLVGLIGTSMMQSSSAGAGSLFAWTFLDQDEGIIEFKACEVYYGEFTTGTLIFSTVKNPTQVKDTASFSVTVAADSGFEELIVEQTSDIILEAEELAPGLVNSIELSVNDYTVYAITEYTIYFSPSTAIDSNEGAAIEIQFPEDITFTEGCSITAYSSLFSSSIDCDYSASSNEIQLNNPFSGVDAFEGNLPLYLTFGDMENPISVRTVGDFTVRTYKQIDGQYYQVDESTASNLMTTTQGYVNKIEDVESSSLVTYDDESVYNFAFSFQHNVPMGGYVRINLPDKMSVANQQSLENYCYRLNYSNSPVNLDCHSVYGVNAIQFQLKSDSFQSGVGLEAENSLEVQVSGLRNPREMLERVYFTIESYDEELLMIDQSQYGAAFYIEMTSIGQITSFSVGMDDKTNGVSTTYIFSLVPNTAMENGDSLSITFPDSVQLPSNSYFSCEGISYYILSIGCVRVGLNGVRVRFQQVYNIGANQGIWFKIHDVRNPLSTRPSGPFTDVLLESSALRDIAEYSQLDTTVVTREPGLIEQKSVTQSHMRPNEDAMYTIEFWTNNSLPYTAAITVNAPPSVMIRADRYNCYVMIGGQKIEDTVCSFGEDTMIKITNAFLNAASETHTGQQEFSGRVEIRFKAKNPYDNKFSQSFTLATYETSSMAYIIDEIQDGLYTTFECGYPCATCDANDPSICTSCPLGSNNASFLQRDQRTGRATCVNRCDEGYTYDRIGRERECLPCDISCKTCRRGGSIDDRNFCITCADDYLYFYRDEAKCYSTVTGCPTGAYEANRFMCSTCPEGCFACASRRECLWCDPTSAKPLLYNGQCMSSCLTGFTPSFQGEGPERMGRCLPCEEPCATCEAGLPHKCTSCALGEFQFQFGSQCLARCPLGTSTNMETKECFGCLQGCEECDLVNPADCIRCDPGLALLDKLCVPECPESHKKSPDGSVCEERLYPLDEEFIPFPFTIAFLLLFSVILISYRITKRKTLIVQTTICALCITIFFALIFQMERARWEGRSLIFTFTLILFILNALLNTLFVIIYQFQMDDYQFNEYKRYRKTSYIVIMLVSFTISLHMFRMSFSKLFALNPFFATAARADTFYKPIYLYSLVQVCCIYVPIIIVDFIGVYVTWDGFWNNQLQMTMFEIIMMCSTVIFLVAWERTQNPRHLVFLPSGDNPFTKGLGRGRKQPTVPGMPTTERRPVNKKDSDDSEDEISEEEDEGLGAESSFWPLAEKNQRHDMLKSLINDVRRNKDLKINEHLDEIMDIEIDKVEPREYHSDPETRGPFYFSYLTEEQENNNKSKYRHGKKNVKFDLDVEAKFARMLKSQNLKQFQDDHISNASYPGLNPHFDGDQARQDLIKYMHDKAEEAAAAELTLKKKIAFKMKFKTKGTAADDELKDNVFFSVHPTKTTTGMNTRMTVNPNKTKRRKQRELAANKARENLRARRTLQINSSSSNAPADPLSQRTAGIMRPESAATVKAYGSNGQDTLTAIGNNKMGTIDNKRMGFGMGAVSRRTASVHKGEGDEKIKEDEVSELEEMSGDEFAQEFDSCVDSEEIRNKLNEIRTGNEPGILEESVQSEDTDPAEADKVTYEPDDKVEGTEQPIDPVVSPVGHKDWLAKIKLMKTLIIDGKNPLKGRGALADQKGIQLEDSKILAEQTEETIKESDCVDPNIESISLEDEGQSLFYKHNEPEPSSISTVRTNDHEFEAEIVQKKEKFNKWLHCTVAINQREFNENMCIGNYDRDSSGRIIDRDRIVKYRNYRDKDEQLVNDKGYLINEVTGAIRNRFTYEDLFLGQSQEISNIGELPMPYRLERYNFNPHKCLGNFNFDPNNNKPYFYKNAAGHFTDKNFRIVNEMGWLKDDQGNIIDNDGVLRLTKNQLLGEKGDIPMLYTYTGESYRIQSIMGQFDKDNQSKEIIPGETKQKLPDDRGFETFLCDRKNRRVNAKGYLIDRRGNIINDKDEIMFRYWELLFQEPPKIFDFLEWDIDWIMGRTMHDVSKNKRHNDQFDLEGRKINTMGYCIDAHENIVDREGGLVFKRELLSEKFGMDAEIPPIFRMRDRLNNRHLNPQMSEEKARKSDQKRDMKKSGGISDNQTEAGRNAGYSTCIDSAKGDAKSSQPADSINHSEAAKLDKSKFSEVSQPRDEIANIQIQNTGNQSRMTQSTNQNPDIPKQTTSTKNKSRPKTVKRGDHSDSFAKPTGPQNRPNVGALISSKQPKSKKKQVSQARPGQRMLGAEYGINNIEEYQNTQLVTASADQGRPGSRSVGRQRPPMLNQQSENFRGRSGSTDKRGSLISPLAHSGAQSMGLVDQGVPKRKTKTPKNGSSVFTGNRPPLQGPKRNGFISPSTGQQSQNYDMESYQSNAQVIFQGNNNMYNNKPGDSGMLPSNQSANTGSAIHPNRSGKVSVDTPYGQASHKHN